MDAEGPRVWHYDGRSALRREAVVVDDGATFRLREPARETGPFAWADLIPGHADTGHASYGLKDMRGWRLGPLDPVPAGLAGKLPRQHRYGRWVDRFGLWQASGLFACLAAIAIVAVLRTPALVARIVPASVERQLGDLMVGDFGRNGCEDPAGRAALNALVARIDGDRELEVYVVKQPMVNAVTLPGGRIVLFEGLLKAAASPDEVAGVIGHEVGHVRHHDVMESLVRQLGLSVLLGGMDGNIAGYTNTLLATAYSRRAEGSADRFAIDLLRDAAISPAGTAGFFRRLGGDTAGAERMLAYLNTHPVSADRARQFAGSANPKAAYRPALDATQWAALRNICRGTKTESGWRF